MMSSFLAFTPYVWLLVVFLPVTPEFMAADLGLPFSILHGIKPVLPADGEFSSVFYPVKKMKLLKNIESLTLANRRQSFGDFIQLTYHPDEHDLIKTFFSMWEFEDETRFAAAFTDQPSEASTKTGTKEIYATLLGISSENLVNKAYVLARYWKTSSSTRITASGLSELATITLFSATSTSDQITDLFAEYGTHYVSGYEMGDMIYQVFVYEKEKAEAVRKRFDFDDPRSSYGPNGFRFRVFTRKVVQENVGYCHEAGTVLSASGDPAFANIKAELKDDVYSLDESIFMIAAKENGYKQLDSLTSTIPIKISIKPIINLLFPQKESLSKSKWNDVLAVTTFQKFGPKSSPNFPEIQDVRVRDVYDSFNPDLVTSTATNYVAITRMTFRLDDFFVLDPEYVTHLFIFADVLDISKTAKIKLPGSKQVYLVCREFVALSSGDDVPEIIVGSHGNTDPVIKIIAEEFHGILKVSKANEETHSTYANKLIYKTVNDPEMETIYTVKTDNEEILLTPDKDTVPEFYEDATDKSLEENWLRGSMVNGLQLAVASAETILTVRTSSESANTAWKTLQWIIDFLNSNELSEELEMVLGRALLIIKTQLDEYSKSRLIVPRLTFPSYKELYETLLTAVSNYEDNFRDVTREIARRRLVETVTNSLQELNTNVKSIGSFLIEQTEVNKEHQTDIADTQQKIHDLEKDRIDREQAKADALLTGIEEAQKEIETAGENFNAAMKNYENKQTVSAVLTVTQVVGSLFVAGPLGLAKIPSAIKGVARVVEKVKHVMTIIEQVSKLYDLGTNLKNDIGTINRALQNVPTKEIDVDDFPTELEWEEFDEEISSYLNTAGFIPSSVAGEALDYQLAAKRLSARGKKYVDHAANIANMKYKQIQIEFQRDLANRQSDRLEELKTKLSQKDLSDNDAKTTDLFELGNIIKMKENQVRSQLVQTFVLMDAALQYYYLQTPTLVERFDTMSIQRAALSQIQSSISALENFPSLPKDLNDPIEYNIPDVPVKHLLSADGYKVCIPLSSLPFYEYIRVRIIKLEVFVDNVKKSKDDTVYIQTTASGQSFQDRDLERKARSYSSFPTEYRSVYNFKTGESIGDTSVEFADKFIRITPFDNWVFRIPNVDTNEGIQFKTTLTTLRMKFSLSVIFHPAELRGSNDRPSQDDVGGSKEDLLNKMDGRSLVRDWDAIMAVNAKRVNEIWQKQYDEKTNEGFVRSITTERSVTYETEYYKSETRLILEVSAPQIQFIPNNQNRATLVIKITSATIEFWESSNSGYENNRKQTVPVTDDTVVRGSMDLLKIRGSLTEDSKVVLDLSNGVFDFINFDFENEHVQASSVDEINIFFNNMLKSSDYEVAAITFENEHTPASLVPQNFYLATGGFGTEEKPGLGTLYIFLTTHSTGSTANEQSKRDFNDPLSLDDQIIPTGFEVVLFVSNRIISEDFLKADIQHHFKFNVHTEDLPGKSVSESQKAKYIVGNGDASHSINRIKVDFDRSSKDAYVSFIIPGNTLQAKPISKGRKIQVYWVNDEIESTVPYLHSYCPPGQGGCQITVEYTKGSFSTSYIKSFSPSIDDKLLISYNEETSVSATSQGTNKFVSFFWGPSYKEARNAISSAIQNYLSGLTFNFQKLSVFAITQVVFPNRNAFHFTEVFIPGDMVILGNMRAQE